VCAPGPVGPLRAQDSTSLARGGAMLETEMGNNGPYNDGLPTAFEAERIGTALAIRPDDGAAGPPMLSASWADPAKFNSRRRWCQAMDEMDVVRLRVAGLGFREIALRVGCVAADGSPGSARSTRSTPGPSGSGRGSKASTRPATRT
jgi:hypothetical protein